MKPSELPRAAHAHGRWPGLLPDGRLCSEPACWQARACTRCNGGRHTYCGHCPGCDWHDHKYECNW